MYLLHILRLFAECVIAHIAVGLWCLDVRLIHGDGFGLLLLIVFLDTFGRLHWGFFRLFWVSSSLFSLRFPLSGFFNLEPLGSLFF